MLTQNGNVHLLVEDIETLLKDICEFLTENVDGGFSGKQKLLAEKLINRSKSQLQTITKFTETLAEPDASYVDMTPKVVSPPKEDSKEIEMGEAYSAVDDQQMNRDCPYISTSASEVKHNNKWGYLERKRSIWFLGHQIRLFGVVIDGWLLLYNSEKDNKPIEFLDLEMYVIKCSESKDVKCKKEPKAFELVSAAKSYQFIAKNAKDMDQWVTYLSKTAKTLPDENMIEESVEFRKPNKPKIMIKELPSLPQTPSIPNPYTLRPSAESTHEPLDTYDDVNVPPDDDENEEENIYECPVDITKPSFAPVQKEENLPPPLPPPPNSNAKSFLHTQKSKSIQPPPQVNELEEDEEVEYDLPLNEKNRPPPLPQTHNTSVNSSFRSTLQKENVQNTNDELDEEEYDEVIAPPSKKPELKPNIQQLINKANLKPAPPKIHPKPMFAGINRGGSITKRKS